MAGRDSLSGPCAHAGRAPHGRSGGRRSIDPLDWEALPLDRSDLLDGTLWQGSFGRTLGLKLLLVAVVFMLSAVHDFVVGPRASEMMHQDPGSASSRRLRRAASWFGRINLILGLVIVMLGVMLVRGSPF